MQDHLTSVPLFLSCLVSIAGCYFSCRSEKVVQIKPRAFHILVLVPLPDKFYDLSFDQGYSIIPAVELAVEQINRRHDILPFWHLILNVEDSGCGDKGSKTAEQTVRTLRDSFIIKRGPVGIVGPACSEDSIFVAKTFQNTLNIPVFYTGTTPYLSEHVEVVSRSYGMISSADILTDTLIQIAIDKEWNWENVAVFYDETRDHFQHTYNAFVKGLNNSREVGYVRKIADSQIPLVEVIERNIRIVVVFSDKKPARQLACLAGQSTVNFVFPIRQLIFIERSLEDFLGSENAEPSFIDMTVGKRYYCDKETVVRGLNGSILLNQALNLVDPDVLTVSNYTARRIKRQYKERLRNCRNGTLQETSYAYAYYDAVWALALGLHLGFFAPVPSFQAIHDAIKTSVSFQGISNWIDFKDRQHVSNDVNIQQVTGATTTSVGVRNKTVLTYAAESFISDDFRIESTVLHPSLAALGLLLIIVLVVTTLVIQILMVIYRDYPSVKASSSRLNHFIFCGCYLFALAIAANTFRQIVPSTNGDALCNLDAVSSTLACTLIFGTILVKSWRTYRIFNHVFKSRMHCFLNDAALSTFIIALTLLQVVLLVPMLVLSPFREVTSYIYDSTQWPPIKRLQSVCSIASPGYITLPLVCLLCVILATVTLATLNRKIRRKNFRRTKHVIILVYTLTIIWAIGGTLLVLFYYLRLSLDFVYFFYTFLLTATIVLCQTLLIVPFLIPVARGQRDSVSKSSTRSTSWRRRLSTQTSFLSDHRLSFLKLDFRRSSMESSAASDRRSSIQIDAQRRSSLQPNHVRVLTQPRLNSISVSTRSSSLRSNSSGSQASLQSSPTSPQKAVLGGHPPVARRITLSSISESDHYRA